MPGPVNAPKIYLPFSEPVIDTTTGLMTRPWINALNAWVIRTVQGPAPGTAVDAAGVSWDGTSGRLVK